MALKTENYWQERGLLYPPNPPSNRSRTRANPAMKNQFMEFSVDRLEDRLLLTGVGADSQSTYEPGIDSTVGFNLVSFSRQRGKQARTNWEQGLQSLSDNGVTHVTLNVYREARASNGAIVGSQGTGNDVLKVSLQKAEELGLHVTLSPIFEVVGGDDSWRGEFNPDGADGKRFQRTYGNWARQLARFGERFGAERLNVGTELVALTSDPANNEFVTDVISTADRFFSGEIGYAANWNNLDNANLAETVWNNSIIDYVGVDAYFSGPDAIVDQATAANSATNPDFITEVTAGWNNVIDNVILPVADAAQDGAGLPVVIQEFGAVPFDFTSVNPFSITPGEFTTGIEGETVDSQEQADVLEGLLNALDGRGEEIVGVNFWTWTFEGNPYDTFGLGPNSSPDAQLATDVILDFVNG